MDLDLRGRRALVTGASRGIGKAIAATLAREGCELILVARDAAALEAVADPIRAAGGKADTVSADLSIHSEIERLAARAGTIEILINNAGAIPGGTLFEIDDIRLREAWNLKLFGYISMIRAFYPAMRARGGVIVNVIGAAGEAPTAGYFAGAVANAGLMAFTRAIAKDAWRDGIRVVAVNPGPVATDRIEALLRTRAERELGDPARWEELMSEMPFGRAAAPQEVADAVVFLASPRSAYTNGALLTIAGKPPA